jgi:hypothetical protein
MTLFTSVLLSCAYSFKMVYCQTKKSKFWHILEGSGTENVGIYFSHFKYFPAIWYILLPFDIFYGHLVYFPPF